MDQRVKRGQIIALSGNSGGIDLTGIYTPQLHFGSELIDPNTPRDCYLNFDPFRSLVNAQEINPYSGSLRSHWTLDNSPIFPNVEINN